jgi:hypothetical protein
MLFRLSMLFIGGLALLAAGGCVPESDGGSNGDVIDPRPVALRLEELPVGFVTREGLFTTGRQYNVIYQLAEQRTQQDSGGLTGLWVAVTSHASLQEAKDDVTIFRDASAAELLVEDFVNNRSSTAGNITVEEVDFPMDGADEVVAYRAKWNDASGYWAVYSIRFRVQNMTSWLQAVTETNADGDLVPEARPTTRAIAEVQARKMADAQK